MCETYKAINMTNIFVIDDHPVVIDGLKSLFLEDKHYNISGSATTAKEALQKLKRTSATVIFLDLIMPEITGAELSIIIKSNFPDKKIIVLTGELDPSVLYNAWMTNVDAILMKYSDKKEIVDTIYSVMQGRRVIGKGVPEFYKEISQGLNENAPNLTRREQQILNLLAKGHNREEVGDLLGSNKNAIDFHCKNLFKKFNKNKLIAVIEEAKNYNLISG